MGRSKFTILIVSSEPENRSRLGVAREVGHIETRLADSRSGRRIQIIHKPAAQPQDLTGILLKHNPEVIHIIGHGDHKSGQLEFQDSQRQARVVNRKALAHLLGEFKDSLRCVVLSACFTEPQARDIVSHIDCAVGTSSAVDDDNAIAFAANFYDALARGKSLLTAFNVARDTLDLHETNDSGGFRLLTSPGVDPGKIALLHWWPRTAAALAFAAVIVFAFGALALAAIRDDPPIVPLDAAKLAEDAGVPIPIRTFVLRIHIPDTTRLYFRCPENDHSCPVLRRDPDGEHAEFRCSISAPVLDSPSCRLRALINGKDTQLSKWKLQDCYVRDPPLCHYYPSKEEL